MIDMAHIEVQGERAAWKALVVWAKDNGPADLEYWLKEFDGPVAQALIQAIMQGYRDGIDKASAVS